MQLLSRQILLIVLTTARSRSFVLEEEVEEVPFWQSSDLEASWLDSCLYRHNCIFAQIRCNVHSEEELQFQRWVNLTIRKLYCDCSLSVL